MVQLIKKNKVSVGLHHCVYFILLRRNLDSCIVRGHLVYNTPYKSKITESNIFMLEKVHKWHFDFYRLIQLKAIELNGFYPSSKTGT